LENSSGRLAAKYRKRSQNIGFLRFNNSLIKSGVVSLLVLNLLSLGACISVNLGQKPGERSKNVEFTPPSPPYTPLKNTPADGAWENKKSGNSISYFSTCNDPSDPSLESVARDLFSGLSDMDTVSQSQPTFNGRGALQTEVEGKVDGVPTRIEALLFKKNGCTYTLSHVGLPKSFASDKKVFAEFLKGFQAP